MFNRASAAGHLECFLWFNLRMSLKGVRESVGVDLGEYEPGFERKGGGYLGKTRFSWVNHSFLSMFEGWHLEEE